SWMSYGQAFLAPDLYDLVTESTVYEGSRPVSRSLSGIRKPISPPCAPGATSAPPGRHSSHSTPGFPRPSSPQWSHLHGCNMATFVCRVQFLDDTDPFNSTNFPEPTRPPLYTFREDIPLINQLAGVHRLLKAPHKVAANATEQLDISRTGPFICPKRQSHCSGSQQPKSQMIGSVREACRSRKDAALGPFCWKKMNLKENA
ncbi:hypothetical protein XENOCAPTIV_004390, partial [Xenoophorus captivus]